MSISSLTVVAQNITIVYEALRLKELDHAQLKQLCPEEAILIDVPDRLVAVWPNSSLVVEFGDERVRVTLPERNNTIGSVPLWQIATDCHRLGGPVRVKAYGFNYDLEVATEEDVKTLIREKFKASWPELERVTGAHLLSVAPRPQLQHERALYDLALVPVEDRRLQVHLNAHFDEVAIPPVQQLESAYRAEFDYLISVLPGLF